MRSMSMSLSRPKSENALPLRWPTSMACTTCTYSLSRVETLWTHGNCIWTTAKSSMNARSTSPTNNPFTPDNPTLCCPDGPEHHTRYCQCRVICSRQYGGRRVVQALDNLDNGAVDGRLHQTTQLKRSSLPSAPMSGAIDVKRMDGACSREMPSQQTKWRRRTTYEHSAG